MRGDAAPAASAKSRSAKCRDLAWIVEVDENIGWTSRARSWLMHRPAWNIEGEVTEATGE